MDDETFSRIRSLYSPGEIIELTATVAFENFLSKFHRALRVEQQGFCARLDAGQPVRVQPTMQPAEPAKGGP